MKLKLFIMMALEFFIWGAWLPLIWPYMGAIGFTGTQQAWIGSAFAIASIVGIFFSNQFADRNFAAEKFVAFSHLIGGLAMFGLFMTDDFVPFFCLMLVHSLFYVPTISVTNSLAFAHLKNPTQEFGIIRMGGTVGWIMAAWPLYFLLQGVTGEELVTAQSYIFVVAGIASLTLAAYSLVLPHTPPKRAEDAGERLAWLKAGKLLGLPFIAVLFFVTLIDATIHAGYFKVTGGFLAHIGISDELIMPVMSVGQVAEILTMMALGYVLKSLGWRWTMILGVLGHALRFGIYAFIQEPWAIVSVQVLHGICYAFFFATVYIFVDAYFPKDVRASAQGLFNLIILGAGDLAANWLFLDSLVPGLTNEQGVLDYRTLFLVPTGMALAGAILLAALFWPPKMEDAPTSG